MPLYIRQSAVIASYRKDAAFLIFAVIIIAYCDKGCQNFTDMLTIVRSAVSRKESASGGMLSPGENCDMPKYITSLVDRNYGL